MVSHVSIIINNTTVSDLQINNVESSMKYVVCCFRLVTKWNQDIRENVTKSDHVRCEREVISENDFTNVISSSCPC